MASNFDLTTLVSRSHIGNLKGIMEEQAHLPEGVPSFDAAEMDFHTAPAVKAAIGACVQTGLIGYCLPDETYFAAICSWMRRVRGCSIEPDLIVPALGTIFSLATCVRLCSDPGESIIVQPPVYNRYQQAIRRLGRSCVTNPLLRTSRGTYSMDMDGLHDLMAKPDNKVLVICNPHNPCGCVWQRAELEQIAHWANEYDVVVFSDEIFADYHYTSEPVTMFSTLLDGHSNAISATSLGKTFSLTGINHANMIIADETLRARFIQQRDQDHYGSLDPLHRAALLGAYSEDGYAWMEEVRSLIWDNYLEICRFFAEKLPEVVISPLQGGYVIWLDFRDVKNPDAMLHEAAVLLQDGQDFSQDYRGFYRMSIATPRLQIKAALGRLDTVLTKKCPDRLQVPGSRAAYL